MSQFKQQFYNSRHDIKDEWITPDWIFSRLNGVFGFTIDAAATRENRKCRNYWTVTDDGLSQPWINQVVFCNPPYTNGQYKHWVNKAKREFVINGVESVLVLPLKPETRAFRPIWLYAKYIIIPYRRIKFDPPEGKVLKGGGSPSFPSCVVSFTNRELTADNILALSKIGRILNLYKGYLRV